jgi:hypothetical protein
MFVETVPKTAFVTAHSGLKAYPGSTIAREVQAPDICL